MKTALFTICLLTLASVSSWAAEIVITVISQGWQISFDGPTLVKESPSYEGGGFQYKANSGRFNVSVFVEKPAKPTGSNQDCYSHYWPMASRNPMIVASSVKHTSSKTFERVQYTIPGEYQGARFTQANVNYFFAYKGKWMDVHISIIEPKGDDVQLLQQLDNTLAYGPFSDAGSGRKQFGVGPLGKLTLNVPSGWQVGNLLVDDSIETVMHTVSIFSQTDINSRCLVSLFERAKPVNDEEMLRDEVRQSVSRFFENGAGDDIKLLPFQLSRGIGFYAIIIDPSLVGKPIEQGNAKAMGSGMILPSPKILGTVTLFVDDPASDDFKVMLKAIHELVLSAPKV